MGKKGKNTAKKKAARQEAKAAEKSDRDLRRDLPAKLDAVLAKGQEETKDIDLFADPPPQEECAICLHPFSHEGVGGVFASFMVHSCCGQTICRGCIHASDLATDKVNLRKKANKEPLLPHTCAFCRDPRNLAPKEDLERFEKRVALNDGKSIDTLASMYQHGDGTKKDEAKALDLYCRAAELGETHGYHAISVYYHRGNIVGSNERQAFAFAEIGAKKGNILARHNLGFLEKQRGNHTLAIKHYKIAAEAGYQLSLDKLKDYLKLDIGLLEEDVFAGILRKFLALQAEMKTDQRDAWDKHVASIVRRG